MTDNDLVTAYESGQLSGWLGKDAAEEHFELLKDQFVPFRIVGQTRETSGRKAMLYQLVRKVLGKDTLNYPQGAGDCTSFGCKNATEYVQCSEICQGQRDEFHPIFPPYFYGCSRVFVGHRQIPANQDGSSGAWTAAAAQQYGVLRADEQSVPAYSGAVAKQWGASGPPSQFVTIAQGHPVKSTARIQTWDDAVAAIVNGYPLTVASNQGFQMTVGPDGFHHPGAQPWPHQMCVIGVDESYQTPYVIILNSWGDVHGHLKDFQTGESLPVGVLRVPRTVFEPRMLDAGEVYAYSQFSGFPEQDLDKALFQTI